MTITQEERDILRSIPLQDVMEKNDHWPVRKKGNQYYYHCPLESHEDSTPSFSVELSPGGGQSYGELPLAAFQCFGCGKIHGRGAIELQAALMGMDARKDYLAVVERLSRDFNLPIGGKNPGDWMYRWSWAEPQDEFSYTPCGWTDEHLKALGCKGQTVTRTIPDGDGGAEVLKHKRYPWGRGLGEGEGFDPNEITRLFGIIPIQDYTVPAKEDKQGVLRSRKFRATKSYPIFAIRSTGPEGRWRIKKYEPYFRRGADGADYKWTWYYEANQNLSSLYGRMLYGDADILDALYSKDVVPTDSSKDGSHPTVSVTSRTPAGDVVTSVKFRRVCLCSGPRDAMNVYFHSDCHVLYPDSESSRIEHGVMHRLREIAQEVYILYDMDQTGRQQSISLNLEHLWARNIELPEDLGTLRDTRSGKRCKDATDYFSRYTNTQGSGIDAHFEQLLSSTCSIEFWDRKRKQTREEAALGQCHYQYSLVIDPMLKFLGYAGMGIYEDRGVSQFVLVSDHIVDGIQDADTVVYARRLMKGWLASHSYHADPDLSNVISTSRALSKDVLRELRRIRLNFKPWTDKEEWLYFANGALCVTADERRLVNYRDIPFHVMRDAVLDIPYDDFSNTFDIVQNPALEEYERMHRQKLDEITRGDQRSLREENIRWKDRKALWPMLLSLGMPMNEQPVAMQYLYDTGRMYWREEESARSEGKSSDKWLSPERRQFHDMQFISKCLAVGYLLSRERELASPRMVFCTDHNVTDEQKAHGRSGKSIMGHLLGFARKVYYVDGKHIKTSADTFAKNFKSYDYLVHGVINMNDIQKGFDAENLYTIAEGSITKKVVFKDEQDLPQDMVAKVLISSNRPFDMSESSTRGRLWPLYFSDYYHADDGLEKDEWNPNLKFGYTIDPGRMPDREERRTVGFLVQCLQIYLRLHRYVPAPIGESGLDRELYADKTITDKDFIPFMKAFFAGDYFFGIPIPKNDIAVAWFMYKGKDVRKEYVESYMRNSQFGKMLKSYCDKKGIFINPSVVFSNPTEKEQNVVKCRAWRYGYNADGTLSQTRELDSNVRCLLFYRIGEVPKGFGDVTRSQVTDPACEGYVID